MPANSAPGTISAAMDVMAVAASASLLNSRSRDVTDA
jgi:hypothetical protein